MIRCALLATALVATVAAAQTHLVARPFPADALRGDLQIGPAPEVLLNSRPARLAPGSRIRGETNFVMQPGELIGQRLLVHYTQESDGLIKDVWVLNAAERANKVWPANRQQAAAWRFDMATDADLEQAMTKKVYIKTFGCQMNEYDSDKMADVMHQAEGYEKTDDPEAADLILFNTCSVREKAQEKVFSDLGRVKHLKAKGVKIGVGGCVASQEGAAIIERAPYVDVVFGPQTLHRLPQLLAERREAGRRRSTSASPRSRSSITSPPPRSRAAPPSSRSWKAARSTAATAWCPTRAARKSAGPSRTC